MSRVDRLNHIDGYSIHGIYNFLFYRSLSFQIRMRVRLQVM